MLKSMLLAALGASALAAPAFAGTGNLAVNVRAEVPLSCTVTLPVPDAPFGTLDLQRQAVSTLRPTFHCDAGATYTISGKSANDTQNTGAFRLSNGTDDIVYTVLWNNVGTLTNVLQTPSSPTTANGDTTFPGLFFQISAQEAARKRSPGQYSDTFTLSIDY